MENAGTLFEYDAHFSCRHTEQGRHLIIRLRFSSRSLHPAAAIIRPRFAVLRNQPVGTILCSILSLPPTVEPFGLLDTVPLGDKARPNHLESVENAKGKVVYVSLARVDDKGPGGLPSSRSALLTGVPKPGNAKSLERSSHGAVKRTASGLIRRTTSSTSPTSRTNSPAPLMRARPWRPHLMSRTRSSRSSRRRSLLAV